MNEGIKKRNFIVYALACIAICIFLLLIYFYDKATDTRQQQSAYAVTEWTDYTKNMYMKKTVVSGTLSVDASVGNVLAFYTVHQNIKVYVGSTLIYQYPVANNNPLSESPGYCWNFIFHTIPTGSKLYLPAPTRLTRKIYLFFTWAMSFHSLPTLSPTISCHLHSVSLCLCSALYWWHTICLYHGILIRVESY